MFIIVDNTRRKIRTEIALRMHEANLPFIMTDLDHADEFMPCALIIVTEKYLYEDMKYISDLNGKTPVVVWDETDMAEFAKKTYFELYGREIFKFNKNRVFHDGKNVRFCSRRMHFTPTEKKIICFLMYCDGWHSKEQIAAFCLKKGKKAVNSVPVHICNINQISRRHTNNNLIFFRKLEGYMVP